MSEKRSTDGSKHILKYRELPEMIGCTMTIDNPDTVEAEVRWGLSGVFFPVDSRLIERMMWTEFDHHAIVLHLTFEVPLWFLESHFESGLPILQELGFVVGTEACELRGGWEYATKLTEDLEQARAFIRLRLYSEVMGEMKYEIGVEAYHYLPSLFKVMDACVANTAVVWCQKYFDLAIPF